MYKIGIEKVNYIFWEKPMSYIIKFYYDSLLFKYLIIDSKDHRMLLLKIRKLSFSMGYISSILYFLDEGAEIQRE